MPSEIKTAKCEITEASIGIDPNSDRTFGLYMTFNNKETSEEYRIAYRFHIDFGKTNDIAATFPFFIRALLRKVKVNSISDIIGKQATVLYTEYLTQKTAISFYFDDDVSDFDYIDKTDLIAVNRFRSYLSSSAGYGLVNIRRMRTDNGLSYKIIPDFDAYPKLLGNFM